MVLWLFDVSKGAEDVAGGEGLAGVVNGDDGRWECIKQTDSTQSDSQLNEMTDCCHGVMLFKSVGRVTCVFYVYICKL